MEFQLNRFNLYQIVLLHPGQPKKDQGFLILFLEKWDVKHQGRHLALWEGAD
jgi:hypothetical protein